MPKPAEIKLQVVQGHEMHKGFLKADTFFYKAIVTMKSKATFDGPSLSTWWSICIILQVGKPNLPV